MKNIVWALLAFVVSCNSSDTSTNSNGDNKEIVTQFRHHLSVLDSVAKANYNDSVYVAIAPSVKFLEDNTAILSSSKKSVLGPVTYSNGDLRKWHEWVENRYGK